MWSLHSVLTIWLVGVAALTNNTEFRCDYEYIESIDGWLKLQEIPANWHEARLRCALEGAVLASPLDEPLRSAMLKMAMLNTPKDRIFTGIHATFSRGDFFSVEGVPLWRIPHFWAPSEPNNRDNDESCLVMASDGSFSNENCSVTFNNYICYKKRTPNMVLNHCGTVDPDYIYYNRTKSCYKFHGESLIWSRAYMACAAEGGYLTIINSEEETGIIKEIFRKTPQASIIGSDWKDVAFIGFHDLNKHGTWLTVHGQTLKEAGYNKFSPGSPNNLSPGQYCGGVYSTALLADLWCNKRFAFICEKDPDSLRCPPNYQ